MSFARASSLNHWIFLALFCFIQALSAQDSGAGVFIVVSKEGEVFVYDTAGEVLPPEESAAGKNLFEGQSIKTSVGGKIILLLSTGSLTTLDSNSQLTLQTFKQKPFEQDPDTKVSDLQTEPSNSEVKLKLGYGELVFNVKKLNPGSTFEIDSPVGNAGIRGTDGQMIARPDPDTGNFTGGVNMLSGIVSFQSVGGAKFDIPAGQAVQSQVTPTGQQVALVKDVPVPPAVTQELTQKTEVAQESSSEVKIADVAKAVEEVEQKIQEAPEPEEPKEEEPSEEPTEEPSEEPAEEPTSEPSEEPTEESSTTTEEPAEETQPASAETTENTETTTENTDPATTNTTTETTVATEPVTETDTTTTDTETATVESSTRVIEQASSDVTTAETQEQLLEVDTQASLAQQGVVEEDKDAATKLKSLGLQKDDLEQLRKVDKQERKELLESNSLSELKEKVEERVEKGKLIDQVAEEDPELAKILTENVKDLELETIQQVQALDDDEKQDLVDNASTGGNVVDTIEETVEPFTDAQKTLFNSYPDVLQQRLENDIPREVAKGLLNLGYSASEMATVLDDLAGAQIIDLQPTTPMPDIDLSGQAETLANLEELRDLLSSNDNLDLLQSLLAMGDGDLDSTLVELGKQANHILTDVQLSGTPDPSRVFTFSDLEANPFFQEPVSLAYEFFGDDTDLLPIPTFTSREAVLDTSLDLSDYYTDTGESYFAITAQKTLSLSGSVDLSTGGATGETHLAILAAETIEFAQDTELRFQGDHLHVGSWGSMELVNVSMESGQSLGIETLEDLVIRDSSLRVRGGDEINLHAMNQLQLNGVEFSNTLRGIYMQATTIDLMNINFPGGSNIYMETLYGGIDGKYPTFPTGDASNLMGNRKVGRVNFIQNVQYNQNLLNNRAQFDQFGQNIHISTMSNSAP